MPNKNCMSKVMIFEKLIENVWIGIEVSSSGICLIFLNKKVENPKASKMGWQNIAKNRVHAENQFF